MANPKRKLTTLSIEQKIGILDALQSKSETRKEVALKYGIGMATITRIVQQEAKIRSIANENGNTARKRLRKGNYEKLDQAVSLWFHQMQSENTVVNGVMIREQAKLFARDLDFPNFVPNNGWLGRWKAKENLTVHKKHCGKAAAKAMKDREEPEVEDPAIKLQEVPGYGLIGYVECDEPSDCNNKVATDGIVEKVFLESSAHGEEDEEQEAPQVTPPFPAEKDALAALTLIRAYFKRKNWDLKYVEALEDQFCDLTAESVVRKKISDFFS